MKHICCSDELKKDLKKQTEKNKINYYSYWVLKYITAHLNAKTQMRSHDSGWINQNHDTNESVNANKAACRKQYNASNLKEQQKDWNIFFLISQTV